MKGYHCTTYRNWLKIRKEGLIPQDLGRIEFFAYCPKDVTGVWLWKREFKGLSRMGLLVHKMSEKCDTKVVLLEASFNPKDRLRASDGTLIDIHHDGTIGEWSYHKHSTAYVVTEPIPNYNIKLLAVYDFGKFERMCIKRA